MHRITVCFPFLTNWNWHWPPRPGHWSVCPIRCKSQSTWPAWFAPGRHAHASLAGWSGVLRSWETLGRPDLDQYPPPYALRHTDIGQYRLLLIFFINIIPQCRALRFTDREIRWVSGWVGDFFSPNISGLRRPKDIVFGTKVVSSTTMMCTLRFLEKLFLIVAKLAIRLRRQ